MRSVRGSEDIPGTSACDGAFSGVSCPDATIGISDNEFLDRTIGNGNLAARCRPPAQPLAANASSGADSRHNRSPEPATITSVVARTAEVENVPTSSLIERVERALVLLAYFIELDGDVHLAMYEKFETELHSLRQKESTKERARRLLLDYSRSGGLNMIRSRNLSLSSSDGP